MDISTITIIVAIIPAVAAVVGISKGATNKARRDGILEQKVDTILDTLEQMRSDRTADLDWRNDINSYRVSSEKDISSLKKRVKTLEDKNG